MIVEGIHPFFVYFVSYDSSKCNLSFTFCSFEAVGVAKDTEIMYNITKINN